ncbi:hypothetical protein O209_13495 [Lactiplantibacillus plantarum WHE 92]|nr:hypothetical protein O209_13495 [Lactiplantibacillus plantarum WHE 92]
MNKHKLKALILTVGAIFIQSFGMEYKAMEMMECGQ